MRTQVSAANPPGSIRSVKYLFLLLLGVMILLTIGLIPGFNVRQAQAAKASPTPTATYARPTITSTRRPTPFMLAPVLTVTPRPDGSIIHIVQPGEVLMTIAEAYKVKLSDLYKLNGLTDKSVIYPNEKLLIKGPDPTATITFTPTATPRPPIATRRPTFTPTRTLTQPPPPTPPPPLSREGDPLILIIVVLVVAGTVLVVAGAYMKRRSRS